MNNMARLVISLLNWDADVLRAFRHNLFNKQNAVAIVDLIDEVVSSLMKPEVRSAVNGVVLEAEALQKAMDDFKDVIKDEGQPVLSAFITYMS